MFNQGSLFDYQKILETQLREAVARMTFGSDDLEGVIARLEAEFQLDPLVVTFPAEIDPTVCEERTVRGPNPYARIPSGATHKEMYVRYEIPVAGNTSLLRYAPNTYLPGFSGQLPVLVRDRFVFEYTVLIADAQFATRVKQDFESLRRHISALSGWVDQWNAGVKQLIVRAVKLRLTDIERLDAMKPNLKIKL
jgi:hypothetical protein